MRSTDEVSTALPDLRAVPLDEIVAKAALSQVVERVLPGSPAPVLVAFFTSALSTY